MYYSCIIHPNDTFPVPLLYWLLQPQHVFRRHVLLRERRHPERNVEDEEHGDEDDGGEDVGEPRYHVFAASVVVEATHDA